MSIVGAVMDVAGLCCRSRMRQRTLLHNAVPYGLRPNPFQRRDHLALSSLRFALGQALSASFGSLAGQRSKARAQDDTPASAAFDSQHVFFEMDWALGPAEGFTSPSASACHEPADRDDRPGCSGLRGL